MLVLAALLASCADTEEDAAPQPTAASVSPTATTPFQSSSATPKPAWKTLTNTSYGYSLEYPQGWLLNPDDATADPTTSSYVVIWSGPPPTGEGKPYPALVKLEIYAVPNPMRLTLDEWLAQRDKDPSLLLTVLASEDISINGVPARRRLVQYLSEGTGEPFFVIHIPRNDFVLEVVGLPDPSAPLRAEVDLIISSMVFQ